MAWTIQATVRAGQVQPRRTRTDSHQERLADGGTLLLGQRKEPLVRRTVDDSSGPNPSVSHPHAAAAVAGRAPVN